MAAFPDGHFYSPVIDAKDLRKRRDTLWAAPSPELPGVDLNEAGQRALLQELRAIGAEYPEGGVFAPLNGRNTFREPNGMFEGLDARMLYALLRHRQPKRLVEVGSGHTSLLSGHVNEQHLGGSCEITCVEPYPPDFLSPLPLGVTRLVKARAQEVDPALFTSLEAGDFLFIDSSHVSKTGSDVNTLYLDVLPRLAPGVVVHVHDVFLPAEYPQNWVLEEERSWNEQYLLQALLTFSSGFRVLFANYYASQFLSEEVEATFGRVYGGGSFWMERV